MKKQAPCNVQMAKDVESYCRNVEPGEPLSVASKVMPNQARTSKHLSRFG